MSKAKSYGCDEAQKDYDAGATSSEVILDFGAQQGNDTGTELINGIYVTYGQVEDYAIAYATGYWNCSDGSGGHSVLYLGIGTNNSTSTCCTETTGASWGSVVGLIRSQLGGIGARVIIRGAIDVETWHQDCCPFKEGYSYQPAFAWESGWESGNFGFYLDYGSANGCPQFSTSGGAGEVCTSDPDPYWDQHAYYWMSYGAPSALPLPEIYIQAMANQWAEIAYYAAVYESNKMSFEGPLDQYGACTERPDCDPAKTNTAAEAWGQLWGALNYFSETAESLKYSVEMWNAT